ncbi:MAG: DivIVA domain-containing protein [Gaiellaceae bacterium]
MPNTPVELRHVRFKRGLFGYRRPGVDEVVEEVADAFETVWRDRMDLTDKLEHLEGELSRYRELEALLRRTLTTAEQSAHEVRDQARREAQLILEEAHAEARAVTRNAAAERERLEAAARRSRALLAAALDAVEDAQEDEEAEAA